jgi:hypothetical protein
VGPAQQMGTFLRVWRSEWAGLSRAQLANALHAVTPRAAGVTPHVIRRWEEGQPPGGTDELQALLLVMRRHELAQVEVDEFLHVVMAACVGRQYPGLLPEDDFSELADCDVLAETYYWRDVCQDQANVVSLVARQHELEQALLGPERPAAVGRRLRKQEAALAWTWAACQVQHYARGRWTLRALVCRRLERLLRSRLGGGIAPVLTADNMATTALSSECWPQSITPLLEMSDQLAQRGDEAGAGMCLVYAIGVARHCAFVVGDPVVLARLRDLRVRAEALPAMLGPEGHGGLAGLALDEGRLDDAARHQEALDTGRDDQHWTMGAEIFWGDFELISGNPSSAQAHYEASLAISVPHGYGQYERDCLEKIEVCLGKRDHRYLHIEPEPRAQVVVPELGD